MAPRPAKPAAPRTPETPFQCNRISDHCEIRSRCLLVTSRCIMTEDAGSQPSKACGALRTVLGVDCELYLIEGRP